MVNFTRKILPNGLRVLIHEDKNTPLVAVNVAYYVGSRDESSAKTGFAHLFEHLMFAGSKNVSDFDTPLQSAGGENNAYTTNDYTTFYDIVPAENIETVLWIESDRMASLNISKKALAVQRKVVVEEFKETCLNEPYGDSWHHLSAMMYKEHPYRWPVIGLVPEHVENATIADVRSFYRQWYAPNNAVLSIAGHLDVAQVLALVEKWFSDIPAGPAVQRAIPVEPPQTAEQQRVVHANVPATAVYMAFRMPGRLDPAFYAIDLIADILAEGHSSRLYRRLLKEKAVFSQIDAYITANIDPGLFIIEGRPAEGVSVESAIAAVWEELHLLQTTGVPERELKKIQNKFESNLVYAELSILNKAQNLGFYELLNRAEWMNEETAVYLSVQADDLREAAVHLFRRENSGTLLYVPQTSDSI